MEEACLWEVSFCFSELVEKWEFIAKGWCDFLENKPTTMLLHIMRQKVRFYK